MPKALNEALQQMIATMYFIPGGNWAKNCQGDYVTIWKDKKVLKYNFLQEFAAKYDLKLAWLDAKYVWGAFDATLARCVYL